MNVYRIPRWDELFESAKSKEYGQKSQAYMPNKVGLGYKRIMRLPDGPAIFGAWCATVQALSRQRCPRQGYLTDTGRIHGHPWTAEDVSLHTDMPTDLCDRMLAVCSSEVIGWLDVVRATDTTVPLPRIPDGPPPLPLPSPLPLPAPSPSGTREGASECSASHPADPPTGPTLAREPVNALDVHTYPPAPPPGCTPLDSPAGRAIVQTLCRLYHRSPARIMPGAEERALYDALHAGATAYDADTFATWYVGQPPDRAKYRPQTIRSALERWHEWLDKARVWEATPAGERDCDGGRGSAARMARD